MDLKECAAQLTVEGNESWQESYVEIIKTYAEEGRVNGLEYDGSAFKLAYVLYQEILNYVSPYRSAYFTPLSVAKQMIKAANVQEGEIVLDPCAGIGALLALARAAGGRPCGYEIQNHFIIASTYIGKMYISPTDFVNYPLKETNYVQPDVILLNPPSGSQQGYKDITGKFLERIIELYKKARVVALLPLGYFSRKAGKASQQVMTRGYDITSVVNLRNPYALKPYVKSKMAIYCLDLT